MRNYKYIKSSSTGVLNYYDSIRINIMKGHLTDGITKNSSYAWWESLDWIIDRMVTLYLLEIDEVNTLVSLFNSNDKNNQELFLCILEGKILRYKEERRKKYKDEQKRKNKIK